MARNATEPVLRRVMEGYNSLNRSHNVSFPYFCRVMALIGVFQGSNCLLYLGTIFQWEGSINVSEDVRGWIPSRIVYGPKMDCKLFFSPC